MREMADEKGERREREPTSFSPSSSFSLPNDRISNVEDRVNRCRFIVNFYERINRNRPRKDFLSPGAKRKRFFGFWNFRTPTLIYHKNLGSLKGIAKRYQLIQMLLGHPVYIAYPKTVRI